MKKVYLVYMDNGESYGDYHAEVEYVFATHEKASLFLIIKEFKPYCERFTGKPELNFVKKTVGWHGDDVEFGAWIVEKDVEE